MNAQAYYCEIEEMAKLEAINRRLYEDCPLSGDERRDLANMLYAVLQSVKACPVKES